MITPHRRSSEVRRRFPQRFVGWQHHGLSARAASVDALAGCDRVREVARLGRDYFRRRPHCAKQTLANLLAEAGWPSRPNTAADAIVAALPMAIVNPEESRVVAMDAVFALRRSGFIISVERTEARR